MNDIFLKIIMLPTCRLFASRNCRSQLCHCHNANINVSNHDRWLFIWYNSIVATLFVDASLVPRLVEIGWKRLNWLGLAWVKLAQGKAKEEEERKRTKETVEGKIADTRSHSNTYITFAHTIVIISYGSFCCVALVNPSS